MKIVLNPTACDGFGYCAELLAGLISVDEWGFPIINNGPVPPHLVGAAGRAVKCCPRRALELDRNDL
jgi:ferredoxin